MQRVCPREEYLVPLAALPDFALVIGSYDVISVTYIHRRTMNERATHTRH
jgi:hypothetical protein